MRLAGPEALHRSAVHLARGSEPVVRELLVRLPMPRTFLLPADDGPLPGAEALVAAGIRGAAVPDCGHDIMLGTSEAYGSVVAAALTPEPGVAPTA